jgi:hypothetical protein
MQTLFLVSFIVELIFALGFLAIPGTLLGTFGVKMDPFGLVLARLFGSALLAFCTLLWYAREKEAKDLKKAAVRSMFVYWLISTVLLVSTQLNGMLNSMGWSTVVLHLVFTIWAGVFAFKE